MKTEKSQSLFNRACSVMPGGVNSAVRSFGSVGGTPLAIKSGKGSRMFTVDGDEVIDFCSSWGPLILGHAHPAVTEAVHEAVAEGLTFGTNTEREVEFAEFLCENISNAEMVRVMNSGTEAGMTALRLARGATGRRKILKFEGCYHGHADHLLVSGGSGLLDQPTAASNGVPESMTSDILVAPYNDLSAVKSICEKHGNEIAAVILEPVAGNMGFVEPGHEFLAGLREAADDCGALLIFDEVITGFRFGPTTYGDICGVVPDLTCLGKIVGGGMSIGSLVGRKDIMQHLSPTGSVYQAGTLSGNPVALAAGLATLKTLREENPYPYLKELGNRLVEGVNDIASNSDKEMHCVGSGSVFTTFFRSDSVHDLNSAKQCDTDAFARFFHGMLENNVYIPPSQFELNFISAAHSVEDIDTFLQAVEETIKKPNSNNIWYKSSL